MVCSPYCDITSKGVHMREEEFVAGLAALNNDAFDRFLELISLDLQRLRAACPATPSDGRDLSDDTPG